MSGTFFELPVTVIEKPGVTFHARCIGQTASCTSGKERAARRAAAKALNASGKLKVTVIERDVRLRVLIRRGYKTTFAARFALGAGKCRVCGCTDEDCSQCIARTGGPCSWVEADLCSACVKQPFVESEEPRIRRVNHTSLAGREPRLIPAHGKRRRNCGQEQTPPKKEKTTKAKTPEPTRRGPDGPTPPARFAGKAVRA